MNEHRKLTYEEVNHKLPQEGLLREKQICNHNGEHGILGISRSNFLSGVKEGRFPKPVRLGKRTVAWKISDIRRILENGVAK